VQALQALGETSVELRATLSYFVEPSPSRRGLGSKYTYPSHGLRFDARRPLESTKEFEARLNALARTEELGTTGPGTHASDDGWVLGPTERHRGSLHADVWRGRAADLAARGLLAVFPTSGWWRTRPHLGSADRAARYALIVSIRAPEIDVDLRTEIESMIRTPIETKGA
ncbi:MAG: hypothetical protein KDB73_16940, partial [Planctomycetes bacterium]|nr:hypothetical protein [Planctomycetota bacterium]